MIREQYPHPIVLGSGSPRRKSLLAELGYSFTIRTSDADETPPPHLDGRGIAEYLAKHKADHIQTTPEEVLITSDTVVWHNGESLAKPAHKEDAQRMLLKLSGNTHEVITGVCLRHDAHHHIFSDVTRVQFKTLDADDIDYYIDTFKPYDKAGAYGIQEWIGMIGIEGIEGSYFNVVGLPVQRLDEALRSLIQ